MTVPLSGRVADRIGIEPTLAMLAFVPLAAAACALPLPDRRHTRAAVVADGVVR